MKQLIWFLILGTGWTIPAFGQEVSTPKVDTIYSNIYGEDRRILLYTPNNVSEGTKLSVIYTLDSDSLFVDMAHMIQSTAINVLPPMAVVAVDYFRAERQIDKGFDDKTLTLSQEGEKFYRYINEELIPHIDSTLITSGFNTLAAHSKSSSYLSTYIVRNNSNFSSYVLLFPQRMEAKSFPVEFKNANPDKIIRIIDTVISPQNSSYANELAQIYLDAGFINTLVEKPGIENSGLGLTEQCAHTGIRSTYSLYITALSVVDNKIHNNRQITWDRMLAASSVNEAIYKQPFAITASNINRLLGRAIEMRELISIEKLVNYYRSILIDYDNAEATCAFAEQLTELKRVKDAERFFMLAIERFENSKRARYVMRSRISFARNLLAKQRAQYDRAWEILEQGKQNNPEDSLIYGYHQGVIAAQYGHNVELGRQYLLDAQNNIDLMSGGHNFTSEELEKYLKMLKKSKAKRD